MRYRTRGRRRRQRIALRRAFDRACDAFELELGATLARIRQTRAA
jgi:hypothetical protein